MATIINTPGNTEDSASNLVAIVLLTVVIIAAIAFFFVYGVPMMQNYQNPTATTIDLNIDRTPRTMMVVPVTPAPTTNTTTP